MSLRPLLSLPTTSMKRTLTVAIASAALLTAAAYGPMNRAAFVAPCDCGLGLFARIPLKRGDMIGEYGGPRLPKSLARHLTDQNGLIGQQTS